MPLDHAVADLWHFHRRAVLICAGLLGGVLVLLAGAALLLRQSATAPPRDSQVQRPATAPPASSPSDLTSSSPAAPATDVRSWNAIHAIAPATSRAYPPVPAAARRDPTAYARAFASELFTRDYSVDRQQLVSWAQYEDAPLRAANYPSADWSKVLVDSLTDLTWDDAVDTPIPADGQWLALRAEQGRDTVSRLRVTPDPQWEQQVADGYQPPDPLATARDVTLTVTRRTTVSGHVVTARFDVSLALQLGTSQRGGYGVAVTNNYVMKEAA